MGGKLKMKRLLYYPSFEVRSINWLKFALLYLDKLSPIIPEEGDLYLSEDYKRLSNETDLLAPYRPDNADSWQASEDAISLIEKILKNPAYYSEVLSESDFINDWKNPETHDFTIFRAKYSLALERFSRKNKLGKRCKQGIKVNRTLGLIFMSLLTGIISDKIDISPITDYSNLYNISILTRQCSNQTEEKVNIAKGIIKLQLPKNLSEISIDKIIKHRNSKGYKERLNAFHLELEKYFIDLENGEAETGFLNSQDNLFKEFSDEIVTLGIGIASFALGLTIFVKDPSIFLPYINQLSIGAVLTANSIIAIRSKWGYTENKRFTRKYLADLEKLQ